MTTDTILYGMPGSLYTAKVRSYLRKQRIPFEERSPAHPHFREHVVSTIGRWIIPVLQTPDGTLVQDGSMIIDRQFWGAWKGDSSLADRPVGPAV